ncbi:hypothetical protein SNOG_15483 [Parastagonospora nodorum SN15]|uniref:Uncharacterized protein n=1 Tax=Phaeosphaeria nodorum (strain SN15 / ATCC MYA-4574 / FGSC 10173) TaxID=321614 RepID=Q0TYE3_PHANO|nr:hypothetical protein SNOG_15483 [Parastagonospora nodorum SN15]EAT77148.2 hypothetical protein SNOG_15483 [Parastagonospora nodorum SN15]
MSASIQDFQIAALAAGFTIGFGILTVWEAIKQTRRNRNPLKSVYIYMIWGEVAANLGIAIIAWLFLNDKLGPRLKWGTVAVITIINIAVFIIWLPAHTVPPVSETFVKINDVWDKVSKVLILIVDAGLNWYFLQTVKQRLVEGNGLTKYQPLVSFNAKLMVLSIAMDAILVGFMFLKNQVVYIQIHPVVYIVKLNIEMSMASLIVRLAQGKPQNDMYPEEKLQSSSNKAPRSQSHLHSGKHGPQHAQVQSFQIPKRGLRDALDDDDSVGSISMRGIHCQTDYNVTVEQTQSLEDVTDIKLFRQTATWRRLRPGILFMRGQFDLAPQTVTCTYFRAKPLPTETGAMDNISPAAMSFEAKIALALQGSNWQALQHQTSSTETNNASTIPQAEALAEESVAAEPIAGVAGIPSILPDMTAKQKKKKERFDQKIARDTGDVLQLIEADTIAPVAEGVTWDQDPELVCSYNWQDSTDQNTIFVPGAPGKWAPRTIPHTLDPDTGFQYSDYNYVRQPRTPYGPMFAAMSTMNPNYNFMSTDVICDRNNLRVLLEFVQGKANGPFRLDLYTIFDTLVIVRNESRWWRHHNAEGYGSNFEKFFTTPAEGMEDATSHYRAIRYPLGPLNVVCRFEADAYDDGAASDFLTESEREAVVSGGVAQRPTFRYNLPIRVLQKGHIVPTAQMVELKTQRARDEFTPVTCQDQLWFGRTSLLYTGSYVPDTGVVNRIRNEDATKRIKAWENNNQESLRKLAALLQMLTAAMKRHKRPNRAVVLVREGKAGPLTLRSMESTNQAIGRDAFQSSASEVEEGIHLVGEDNIRLDKATEVSMDMHNVGNII